MARDIKADFKPDFKPVFFLLLANENAKRLHNCVAYKRWKVASYVCVIFQQFQALEEQRIRFLRNEMWLYTNLGSQLSVDEDKVSAA